MSRRRAWALSGLVAERCGDRRRAGLRASAWLELVADLGRVDPGGEAVLCLVPPWPPLQLVAVMGRCRRPPGGWARHSRPAVVAGGGGPVERGGVVGGAGALNLWRCRKARQRLRTARPAEAWCLRNFASARPGAGRALLHQVCAEADREARVVYLDTAAPQLVEYYARSGFEVAATQVVCRSGRDVRLYRMVRQPRRR